MLQFGKLKILIFSREPLSPVRPARIEEPRRGWLL